MAPADQTNLRPDPDQCRLGRHHSRNAGHRPSHQVARRWPSDLPADAHRARRRELHDVEVSIDGYRRREPEGLVDLASTKAKADFSSSVQTPGSPHWANSCVTSPSMSCPSSSMCCRARCPWWAHGRIWPTSWPRCRQKRLAARLVTPGLTGLWQVSGRSDLEGDEAVRLDLRYVENWSMTMDLLILWKTMSAVLRRAGAR